MLHPTGFVVILVTLSFRPYIRLELNVGIPTLIWLPLPLLPPPQVQCQAPCRRLDECEKHATRLVPVEERVADRCEN